MPVRDHRPAGSVGRTGYPPAWSSTNFIFGRINEIPCNAGLIGRKRGSFHFAISLRTEPTANERIACFPLDSYALTYGDETRRFLIHRGLRESFDELCSFQRGTLVASSEHSG